MADISAANWSETDASNNQASPNGWTSSTMLPSQVEPTARGMMGAIKRFWNRINASATSTGSDPNYVLTYSVAPSAYVVGEVYRFIPSFTNSGSATLNINGLGALLIGYHGLALVGGEIVSGRVATVVVQGSNFKLLHSETDTSNASNLTSGTLATARLPIVPIANGGSGQATALAAFNALVVSAATIATPGYIKFQDGLILQWGVTAYVGVISVTANFPLTFPTGVGIGLGVSNDVTNKPTVTLSTLSTTQIGFTFDKVGTGSVYWFAIGN